MTAPIPRDIPDLPALPGATPSLLPSPVPARAVVPPVRRPLVAAYRALLALTATAAVTAELLLGSPTRVLSYFSIQSTLLLVVVTLASARRAWTARHPLPGAITGATLLYVTMAALVHHVLLAGATPAFSMTGEAGTLETIAAHTLHTVIPAAALLDWLLLSPPARTHIRQATTWMLYPLAYLAFTLARGELLPGSPTAYLYPFLDVTQDGYKSVLANALLVGLSFYALAALLVALDHTRPNPVRRRR
ncbi:Pr6Pr family membrane protein [Streptomyces sp. 15-116A]|uniref:Pr6Pr family membrane protein n=1 Tax=Streptomyces sp. 15-116A TaxID=2259035 RepID=UPI0021B3D5D2|nr:Pr6Pr family membrane protein [Streptomyces sp. 15-116A]MCT7352580.1 Pr6Pr family membrane protein [Streptomyces sp. 15-116A]